jgi:leucyl/phenylalanyl-tRNA---protein transferase
MDFPVQFPDPGTADENGVLAVGGELSPEFLISAYAQGVFPWFNEGEPYFWWCPDPRLVLFPQKFKVSKSLRQKIRSNQLEIRIDENFRSVIQNCSAIRRFGQSGTWITQEMIKAYCKMHKLGLAHSFETYKDGELVGGLYGVSLGRAFFGESMFYKVPDASKVALYYLVQFCIEHDFQFIDAQQSTPHMKRLGAEEISREEFLSILKTALESETMQGKWK